MRLLHSGCFHNQKGKHLWPTEKKKKKKNGTIPAHHKKRHLKLRLFFFSLKLMDILLNQLSVWPFTSQCKKGDLDTYQCQVRPVTEVCMITSTYCHSYSSCPPGSQGHVMATAAGFQSELNLEPPSNSLNSPHWICKQVVLEHHKDLKYFLSVKKYAFICLELQKGEWMFTT